MYGSKQLSLKKQRGISLTSLILSLGVILMVGMFAMKVFPYVLEYRAAKNAIQSVKNTTGSVAQQKYGFDKSADINGISSISSRDVYVYKVNGQTEVAFDYETKIPLFTNVALLVRWKATTDPTGTMPDMPAAPQQ